MNLHFMLVVDLFSKKSTYASEIVHESKAKVGSSIKTFG